MTRHESRRIGRPAGSPTGDARKRCALALRRIRASVNLGNTTGVAWTTITAMLTYPSAMMSADDAIRGISLAVWAGTSRRGMRI